MKPLVWVKQLATHDETVDSQHRHLFDLYNRVASLDDHSIDRDRLFQELFDYAQLHFHDEETLMVAIQYPSEELERHRKSHASFLRTLESLRREPNYAVLDFIHEWLLRHIFIEDRKIGVFQANLPQQSPSGEQ